MEKQGHNFFEKGEVCSLLDGLQLAQCMLRGKEKFSEDISLSRPLDDLTISDVHSCSSCSVQFTDLVTQRAHFKLDWHRYNIKRQLIGLSAVGEEAFDSLADKDDIESISGSESESDSEDTENESSGCNSDTNFPVRHAKVFFSNKKGQLISVYRCLLLPNKESLDNDRIFLQLAGALRERDTWAVVMLGGGHFAAAIFKGMEPIAHKTFHCYTVRAKQGGSQSNRDNKGGSHPKSAGASLRRYNEQSLVQHVQDIISVWADQLKLCHLIFYRAVGPQNRSVLFGGKTPPFDKNDPRLRTIPFPTRRATYSEVKRVHSILSTLEVHGMDVDFQSSFPPSPQRNFVAKAEPGTSLPENTGSPTDSPRRSKSQGKIKPNRAKSRPSPQRPLPVPVEEISDNDTSSVDTQPLHFESVGISLGDNYRQYGDIEMKNVTASPKCKNQKSKSDKAEENVTEEKQLEERKIKSMERKARKAQAAALRKQLEEEEAANNPTLVFQKELLSVLQSEDVSKLNHCLSEEFLSQLPNELPGGLSQCLNLPLLEGNTALHVASKAGQTEMISVLMMNGASPSVWNKKSQPPYSVAGTKEARKAFRDFLSQYPDMYDYQGSQIPTPLSEQQEQEKLEKKAALKKAKREKEKDKKKVQAEERKENEEKNRFLALSDREKRALAAERRLLAAQSRGTTSAEGKSAVLARCFLCAVDITGRVPFEYDIHRFCSMDCLKSHRLNVNATSR